MKCPKCGSEDVVKTAYGERWRCNKCGHFFKKFPSEESQEK